MIGAIQNVKWKDFIYCLRITIDDRKVLSYILQTGRWAIQAAFCKNTYTASVSWSATLFWRLLLWYR